MYKVQVGRVVAYHDDCKCLKFVHNFGESHGKNAVRESANQEDDVYDPIARFPGPIGRNDNDSAKHQGEAVYTLLANPKPLGFLGGLWGWLLLQLIEHSPPIKPKLLLYPTKKLK